MFREIRSGLGLFTFLTLLTGAGYPLFMTIIGQSFFPFQANGSLVKDGDKIIGSELIGQTFLTDRYFHPRPSAAGSGYDAASSMGSNLGPSSKTMLENVSALVQKLRETEGARPIPVDLVTSSASGLDPDISIASAQFQAERIAKARGLPLRQVERMILLNTTHRFLDFLGENRVNVLALNRALDLMPPVSNTPSTTP